MKKKLSLSIACAFDKAINAIRCVVSFFLSDVTCYVCSKPVIFTPICRKCALRYYPAFLHPVITNYSNEDFEQEDHIKRHIESVDRAFHLFGYSLWDKRLMINWKSHNLRAMTRFYAQRLHDAIIMVRSESPTVHFTFIPPRKGKIFNTGYDQIIDLIRVLRIYYGDEFEDLLERTGVVEQKSLSKAERIKNVGKTFRVKTKIDHTPEIVCVIDDIITTGSTIETCASVLKAHGTKKVYALSLYATM